ncbi:hypothetical protein ACXR0O_08825 [Verrucomicrobiota bacterium sgz303538]
MRLSTRQMKLAGLRVHIAGSAGSRADVTHVRYTHKLVKALVEALWEDGAHFLVEVVAEHAVPAASKAPAAIFDWSVIETVERCERGKVSSSPRLHAIASGQLSGKVPTARKRIWDSILNKNLVRLESGPDGWSSGAIRRQIQSLRGDVLICVSGGEGVEHLATLYRSQNKPVIALDLDLGSSRNDKAGGGYRIHRRTLAHPGLFFDLLDQSRAGSLLEKAATHGATKRVPNVVTALVDLLGAIIPPSAFYVRLLNEKQPEYQAVETFFRKVVDPVVEKKGLRPVQMSKTQSEGVWMNVEIFDQLRKASVVIVDLTGLRHNCFTEMGFAYGQGKPVVVTFHEDTRIPFDTSAIEGLLWNETTPTRTLIKKLGSYWDSRVDLPPLSPPPLIL